MVMRGNFWWLMVELLLTYGDEWWLWWCWQIEKWEIHSERCIKVTWKKPGNMAITHGDGPTIWQSPFICWVDDLGNLDPNRISSISGISWCFFSWSLSKAKKNPGIHGDQWWIVVDNGRVGSKSNLTTTDRWITGAQRNLLSLYKIYILRFARIQLVLKSLPDSRERFSPYDNLLIFDVMTGSKFRNYCSGMNLTLTN